MVTYCEKKTGGSASTAPLPLFELDYIAPLMAFNAAAPVSPVSLTKRS